MEVVIVISGVYGSLQPTTTGVTRAASNFLGKPSTDLEGGSFQLWGPVGLGLEAGPNWWMLMNVPKITLVFNGASE